ncbi:SDR family oxidoreductase [Mycolicibacterium smegmatis]|uniref:SDR family oxidoreductase n=1 Tax=Mycolicibacterium smegmatis TaxID=1772 RepID=UPI000DEA96CE|nr:SDR family oxidoreductase [Mycolicibacterium smegmatis]
MTTTPTDPTPPTANSLQPSLPYSGPRPINRKSHSDWTTKRVPLNAIAAARRDFGGLDIVVANAGVVHLTPAWEIDDDEWNAIVGVNLTGVFNTLRSAARAFIDQGRGGSVICTGSTCSRRAQLGLSAYTASKHGVLGLVRSFALELAPHGIRVNLVEPGNTDTPMIHHDGLYRRVRPDLEQVTRDDVAAGFQTMNALATPWVQPVDVSSAVVWLASDAARYVTGIELPVDAGHLIT